MRLRMKGISYKRYLSNALILFIFLFCTACTFFADSNTPSDVEQSSEPTSTFQKQPSQGLKTVVILATGGTIAGVGDSPGGDLDIQTIIDSVPGVDKLANLEGIQICNIPSDNISDTEWIKLTNTINEKAKDPNIAGFVVTHGTDTLEETAYFLHLTAKTNKPIVVTGSMRNATAISPDGPMNLYKSVAVAANPDANDRGVMVVFSDMIYNARDVEKVSTVAVSAFSEQDRGSLGYVDGNRPYFYNQTTRVHTKDTEFDVSTLQKLPKVEIVHFYVDADAGVLDYLAETAEGIVIAGAGYGGLSDDFIMKNSELANKGMIFVLGSRVSNGAVNLKSSPNNISSDNLSPLKARILLQLALTETRDPKVIAEMFSKY